MSTRQTRPRRHGHQRRTLAPSLMIGGALLLLAIVGFLLMGPGLMSGEQQLALGTPNVKGLATAPVEVEEWSDFQ